MMTYPQKIEKRLNCNSYKKQFRLKKIIKHEGNF
jgi:hypothetical protein